MNNWTSRTEILSQIPLLSTVTRTKAQLDAIRPLPEAVEGRVMQKIRLDWNFHSNAIEGNKLTFGETYSFLMYGLTAKGKPLKDHLDIRGHNEAVNFLISILKDDRDLTESEIRELHKMILVEPYKSAAQTADGQAVTKTIHIGEYKQMPNHVRTPTGEIHYYANPEDVPMLMGELVSWYNEARRNEAIHPSVLAAFFHHRFVAIHPFDDGNGRLARILMNLILMQKGYPPAVVKLKERTDYYAALAQADKNEYEAIVEFVAELVLDSMNLYLKAAKGENIEEDADLDKEIALFKMGFEKEYKLKSKEAIIDVFQNVFQPIIRLAEPKLSKFDDMFLRNEIEYKWHYEGGDQESEYQGNTVAWFEESEDTNFQLDEFEKIAEDTNIIDGAFIERNWFDFNKTKQNIDFSIKLYLALNRVNYSIIYSDKVLLNKSYYYVISDFEKQKVANDWVRLAFEDLKQKIEESKK